MSALKAYTRKLEWGRILKEQMAQSPRTGVGSNSALHALRRALAAPVAPYVPPTVESSPPDWQKIAGSLMMNIEGLMRHQSMQRRSSPRAVPDDDDGVPAAEAPAPAPTPAKPTMPREIAIGRDIDGRATHVMAGDTRYNLMRDREGKIIAAESDHASVIYQRGLDGRIAGARIEPKGTEYDSI